MAPRLQGQHRPFAQVKVTWRFGAPDSTAMLTPRRSSSFAHSRSSGAYTTTLTRPWQDLGVASVRRRPSYRGPALSSVISSPSAWSPLASQPSAVGNGSLNGKPAPQARQPSRGPTSTATRRVSSCADEVLPSERDRLVSVVAGQDQEAGRWDVHARRRVHAVHRGPVGLHPSTVR